MAGISSGARQSAAANIFFATGGLFETRLALHSSLFPAFDVHRHLAVILEKHRDRAAGDVHRRRGPRLLNAARLRRQLLLFPALQLQVGFPAQEPYHVRGQPVALPLRCLRSLISLISLRMRMIFALDGSLFPLALSDDRIL